MLEIASLTVSISKLHHYTNFSDWPPLSQYPGSALVILLEREVNQSTQGKNPQVRLRSTQTQSTYDHRGGRNKMLNTTATRLPRHTAQAQQDSCPKRTKLR